LHVRPLLRLPSSAALFPYTTLFRSSRRATVLFHRLRGRPAGAYIFAGITYWLAVAAGLWPRQRNFHGRQRQQGHPDRQSRSGSRSEEHTSELQSREKLGCRLLLDKE